MAARMAPTASGARGARLRTAVHTVKTRKNVPTNSVAYRRIKNSGVGWDHGTGTFLNAYNDLAIPARRIVERSLCRRALTGGGLPLAGAYTQWTIAKAPASAGLHRTDRGTRRRLAIDIESATRGHTCAYERECPWGCSTN